MILIIQLLATFIKGWWYDHVVRSVNAAYNLGVLDWLVCWLHIVQRPTKKLLHILYDTS